MEIEHFLEISLELWPGMGGLFKNCIPMQLQINFVILLFCTFLIKFESVT